MLSNFSHARIFATLGTVAFQASQSVGFSRQEYWVACHTLLGDPPNPGIKDAYPASPALQADS